MNFCKIGPKIEPCSTPYKNDLKRLYVLFTMLL